MKFRQKQQQQQKPQVLTIINPCSTSCPFPITDNGVRLDNMN